MKFVYFCLAILPFSIEANLIKEGEGKDNLPRFSIGSALRYLSKSAFTKALIQVESNGDIEFNLRQAHLEDSSDCVKRFVCEIQSKNEQDLAWDENLFKKIISSDVDYESPILQFQLAADLGTKKSDRCSEVYNRCTLAYSDILELIRLKGTSLEINSEKFGCTVLFLWNKKS